MAIQCKIVRDSVFAISAVKLLSGSLHFVDTPESTTSAFRSEKEVPSLFLRIVLKQIFKKEDRSKESFR